ncbi:hypothetical protein DKQ62_01295 [Halomonas elongata]|nr:hypothetical protein DKQ62_01295 [Halomonas elongata]
MRALSLLFGAIVIAGLAGCSYQPARLTPEPLIEIGDGGHHHGGHGRGFCPPGQAKKGRC